MTLAIHAGPLLFMPSMPIHLYYVCIYSSEMSVTYLIGQSSYAQHSYYQNTLLHETYSFDDYVIDLSACPCDSSLREGKLRAFSFEDSER